MATSRPAPRRPILVSGQASLATGDGEDLNVTSPEAAFTEQGFKVLLRKASRDSPATTQGLREREPKLDSLDAAPDTATAWSCGLYITLLGRLPQNDELIATANRIRSGEAPSHLFGAFLASEEVEASGLDRPADLGVVFLTGCYWCVLGREPDIAGLESNLKAYAAGIPEEVILSSFIESVEASTKLRFPPVGLSEGAAIGHALQRVILGTTPTDAVGRDLGARYESGESVKVLIEELIAEDGDDLQNATAMVVAEAKLLQLVHDTSSDRAWQWRGVRRTWEMLGEVQRELKSIREILGELQAAGNAQSSVDSERS